MTRKKTSQAVYKTARFNPGTNDHDAKVVETIAAKEAQGFNFKQIAEDAILRAEGFTPEMFAATNPMNWMSTIEGMLAQFQQEILSEIRKGGLSSEQEGGEPDSRFAKNFAKSFMQRQQRAVGDEE